MGFGAEGKSGNYRSMKSLLRWVSIAICLWFSSCSKGPEGPKLVPVEGVVTLDGKPLAAADVMFIPVDDTKGQGGAGRTDAAGKFALQSHDRQHQGAPAGNYRVIVSKLVKPDGSDYVPDPNAGPFDTGGFKDFLPAAYRDSDAGQSKLTAEVPEGGTTTVELRLSSKAR